MEKEAFFQELKEKAEKVELFLQPKQLEQFFQYKELLLEWNTKMNLTAITDEKEIILKHFIDSITIAREIEGEESILDIGTGAGFPGIPLKIVKENTNITLLDSLQKRITFLQEVIEKLELEKIKGIHARAEELAKQKEYREQYDIVVSRAVAPINTLLEYMLPYVAIGGKCICMKGPKIEEESTNVENAVAILGGKIEEKKEIVLPQTDIRRNIIIIRKQKNTPEKYPRKAGIPSKQPL